MLFNFVYSSEYVLPVSLENVITFLAFDNLVVTLGIKDYVNRDSVKCFARSPVNEVGALFTSEWNIRWALEKNEGLKLSEFGKAK